MVCDNNNNPTDNPFNHCVRAQHWLAQKKFIIMQACKVRRKKSCAATGCIFVCSMIHGLCRGEKMGGCVWLHISNTFFHHHHHQQPLARFVNHCVVKYFIKSNHMFYVCLIWDLSVFQRKNGRCVWLHISNTFFHHHHHQQPLARFVEHCVVKLFLKSNLISFKVCLI